MRGLETHRRWLIIVPIAASGTFFALRGDGADGFWVNHPLLGSLTSGVMLLVFAAFCVDGWFQRREERRWHQVAKLSCHVLGDDVTRPITVGLAALYAERPGWAQRDFRANWDTQRLTPLQEVRTIPAGRAEVSVLDASELPPADPGTGVVPDERLRILLADQPWRRWSVNHLRGLRRAGRAVVAEWAPVMISADAPRALLNHVASLNDEVGELRVAIERVDSCSTEDTAAQIDEVLKRWQLVDVRARLATNSLWASAGQGGWAFVLPSEVQSLSLEDAFDHPGRVGPWTPAVGRSVLNSPEPKPETEPA